jgi:hypothetical protein
MRTPILSAICFALCFVLMFLGIIIAIHIETWLGLTLVVMSGLKFWHYLPAIKGEV